MISFLVWTIVVVILLLILYRVACEFIADAKIQRLIGLLLAVLFIAWVIGGLTGYGPYPSMHLR